MVNEIKDDNFAEEILKSGTIALIDFWAPWCGPCYMVSAIVEKLSGSYSDKMEFYKMNVDEAPLTAQNYGIMSIPALMLFKNGQRVNQVMGAVPESVIEKMISSVVE